MNTTQACFLAAIAAPLMNLAVFTLVAPRNTAPTEVLIRYERPTITPEQKQALQQQAANVREQREAEQERYTNAMREINANARLALVQAQHDNRLPPTQTFQREIAPTPSVTIPPAKPRVPVYTKADFNEGGRCYENYDPNTGIPDDACWKAQRRLFHGKH
jgi:hypothetical protein